MWKQVTDKQEWNSTLSSQHRARFLQSWEWGAFQEACGKKIVRLSWNNTFFIQAIQHTLPHNKTYWYIPHGPIAPQGKKVTTDMLHALKHTLTQKDVLFCRVDPITAGSYTNVPYRFVPATQPACTRILDLSQPLEMIKANMHQKTRYNIGVAEKKGVIVEKGDIATFNTLNHQTTERDKFVSHSDNHYQRMASHLPESFLQVWHARLDEEILASALVVTFGDTVTYVHGASSNEQRNVMAPYALHWHVIQQAKEAGAHYYDWWGCNPTDTTHPAYKPTWEGITRFKKGFGGELVCYAPSVDLIFDRSWYTVYKLLQKLKKFL